MERTGECILRSAVTSIDIPASWLMEQWLYAMDEGSVAYDAFSQNLFPVDYSDATTATVPAVKEIAQRFDSTITVLNAFNLVRESSLALNVEGMGPGHSRGIFLRTWTHLYSIIRESPCSVLSVRFAPLVGV